MPFHSQELIGFKNYRVARPIIYLMERKAKRIAKCNSVKLGSCKTDEFKDQRTIIKSLAREDGCEELTGCKTNDLWIEIKFERIAKCNRHFTNCIMVSM
jgi:hypothetical protein